MKRDLLARKAKRDEDRARKAEEERKRREQEDLLDQQRKVTTMYIRTYTLFNLNFQ